MVAARGRIEVLLAAEGALPLAWMVGELAIAEEASVIMVVLHRLEPATA